jgi:hypothetical protein
MLEITCSICSKVFTMDDGEIALFESKGYQMRKHCKECTAKLKKSREASDYGKTVCDTCGVDVFLNFTPKPDRKYYCQTHYQRK